MMNSVVVDNQFVRLMGNGIISIMRHHYAYVLLPFRINQSFTHGGLVTP